MLKDNNDHRRLQIALMMTSKLGIITSTIFGVVVYLVTFLGITLGGVKSIENWKILIGALGGTVLVGLSIIFIFIFLRKFLLREK